MRTHTGTELLHPGRLLDRLGISSGHHVADIGCGSLGHFVYPLSRRVGADGRVYAIDIRRRALDVIDRVAKEEQLFNIRTVWGDMDRVGGIRVEDESTDAALLVNTLSISKSPRELVRELSRLTRQNGIILLVDWNLETTPFGPAIESRVSKETAREWFHGRHFTPEDEFEASPYHYGIVFRKN